MDVTITGRHVTVSETAREAITERLNESVTKLKDRVIRAEVEFTLQQQKGDPDESVRCEITLRGRGPVVRASGHASDKIVAFDNAHEKLMSQLRRAADRRKHRHDLRGKALAPLPEELVEEQAEDQIETRTVAGMQVTGEGPLVVREKEHTSAPLTLEQALDEMELVGHDFFLYVDKATNKPSVVYRRKAYNYGVIHLTVADPE